MQDNDSYLRGKKILITGISGFVGSHLSVRLTKLGAKVFGISRSLRSEHILKASILDYEKVSKFIKERKFEICFHLGGESLVETGQEDPYKTFKVNVEGTLNILECARKYAFKKIIIASTVHVYGRNKVPYLESYTPRPTRPYETSKACTDLLAQSYADTYDLPVLIPRFVNIYGPGDLHFTRLIPKTMRQALLGKTPTFWGGEAVREYLFIDDAIDAYVRLAVVDLSPFAPLSGASEGFRSRRSVGRRYPDREVGGASYKIGNNRIFNFGSGDRISVREIIAKIISLSGSKLRIERVEDGRELEIPSAYVSSRKAQKILGWKAGVSLDEGLRKTYAWYEKYFKN